MKKISWIEAVTGFKPDPEYDVPEIEIQNGGEIMAEKGMCDYPMKKGGTMKPEPGESKSYEEKEEKAMKKMMSKPKKGGK